MHVFKFKQKNFLFEPENGTLLEVLDFEGIEDELKELEKRGVIPKGCTSSSSTKKRVVPKKLGEIKAVCLNVCHDCNLACEYCFAGSNRVVGKPKTHYMTLDTAKASIDFLMTNSGRRKNLEVDFFGGEPLLNWDVVVATVDYAREQCKIHDKNIHFTLTTNGVLLEGDKVDYINQNMDNVVISIDGRRHIHDALRKNKAGYGSYERVVKNALAFKSLRGDKKYYIRGTFTSKNLDFSSDILHINDLGFDQISLEPVVLEHGHELALTEDMLDTILAEYERFADEYIERRKTDKWFNFFHFMIDLKKGPCVYKRLHGCGAGDEYLAITPQGDIYPCHQFIGNSDFLMGNVVDFEGQKDKTGLTGKTGLTDTKSAQAVSCPHFKRLQNKFQESNVYTKDKCGDCFARYFCGGGCVANFQMLEGDMDKTNKVYCQMMKKRMELAMGVTYGLNEI